MKTTGTIRRMDELGRIVLPIEIRRTLDIAERDEIEITLEDNRIILKKYEQTCVFCGEADDLVSFRGRSICHSCLENLKENN